MTLDYPHIPKTLDTITPISADMGGLVMSTDHCHGRRSGGP